MRKIYIDDLPKRKYGNKFVIDWNRVNGHILNFQYDNIIGKVKIVNASSENKIIDIEYNNIVSKIDKTSLISCKIGRIIGKYKNRGVILGLSDIPTTDPWMIPYFQGGYDEAKLYAAKSDKKIYPICPDCGRIRDKTIRIRDMYKMRGIGCICSDSYSYPKKFMYSLLKQTLIDFEMEFNPDWAFGRLYDFYVPSLNIIIETDGGFHFEDNRMSGMSKEESQYIDKQKDKYAMGKNIEVVRIDCKKSDFIYIVNSIKKSKLSDYFNLENIDFIECGKFASKNFRKTICDFYSHNTQLFPKEIANIFKISRGVVTDSLKIGTTLGWCKYDPKKNLEMGRTIGREKSIKNAKNIYVFDLNGDYLESFESAGHAERELTFGYNKKFRRQRIKKVIQNKTYQYNGFLFFSNFHDGYNISKNIQYRRMKQSVNQYDLSGKFIKQYNYPTQAENETGIPHNTICRCCLRKSKSAGGFIWRYSDDCEDVENEQYMYISNCGKHRCKKIIQYDKKMNYINQYDSITNAANAIGLKNNGSAISGCCRGIKKTAYGYVWKYAESVS